MILNGPNLNCASHGGPANGGTLVTITGKNFTQTSIVKFGKSKSDKVVVISPTKILALSPPGNGTVHVRVKTAAGISAKTRANRFTYLPVPRPPIHVQGFQKIKRTEIKNEYINILSWQAPKKGAAIVLYKIYRHNRLEHAIGKVFGENSSNANSSSDNEYFHFKDFCRKPGKTYVYDIVSYDAFGNASDPAKVKVKPRKRNL